MIMSCLPFFYPIFMYECLDACVVNYVLVQYVCTQYCTRSMYIQYIRVYTVHTVIQIMENVAEMPVGYKKLLKIVVRIAGNCLQYSNYFQVVNFELSDANSLSSWPLLPGVLCYLIFFSLVEDRLYLRDR